MRRPILLALIGALSICGCDSSVSPSASRYPSPAQQSQPQNLCHHKTPAQAGECIQQGLEAEGITLATPGPSTFFEVPHATCVDISRWQGLPNWTAVRQAGVRCVIVQTNDGGAHNPLFAAQVTGAFRAGLKIGVYLFVEGGSASYQVAVAKSVARSVPSSYITLGGQADAEVSSAYAVTCAVVHGLHAGFRVVGVYGSPGTYRGGRCEGYVWPAEWGSGRAYPLPGYPDSAIKFRQNCGTCRLNGFSGEVDRDEDLGLLALASPPKPTHAQIVARWHRELDAHYRLRAELHGDIDRHRCRLTPPTLGHAVPARYHTLCGRWVAHGKREAGAIDAFHRKEVF